MYIYICINIYNTPYYTIKIALKKGIQMPHEPINEEVKENINETDEKTIENKDENNDENVSVIASVPETIYETNDGKNNDNDNNNNENENENVNSFIEHRNNSESINKIYQKHILIQLNLSESQYDLLHLETLSHLSNKIFIEYTFITLSNEIIGKLLQNQILKCRQVHMYKNNSQRSNSTTILQLLFTLYVLIHLKTIIIDASITLSLLFFKLLYSYI